MTYDLLIIGGGINGCAIAREAALNHLSVLLVEKDDLASHTSSASSKLIHGGLRYLEQYAFRLVREALLERERLLAAAPHIITPLTFVLPHDHAVRPWWVVRLGLYLYDALAGGGSSLPRSRGLKAKDIAFTAPLKAATKGFVYSDAWVDDSRLTILNAVDAADHGAEILTHTAFEGAHREGGLWHADIAGRAVTARSIVVAAGAWVPEALSRMGVTPKGKLRLIKGSHIVVASLFAGDHAYILQQPDKRIVFAVPYEGGTMIGTTDIPVERPQDAVISPEETAYLCDAANRYFTRQITPKDVTSTWSGVRALYDDGASAAQQVTRDYVLELDDADKDGGAPPVLSVFGGKITTARALAEDAIARLGPKLGKHPHPVTRARAFPGGMIAGPAQFVGQIRAAYPFLGDARAQRMASAYGSRLIDMLAGITDEAGMGQVFGAGLTELEARFVHDHEWAQTPADVLERRTKIGLALTPAEHATFVDWWHETFPG